MNVQRSGTKRTIEQQQQWEFPYEFALMFWNDRKISTYLLGWTVNQDEIKYFRRIKNHDETKRMQSGETCGSW